MRNKNTILIAMIILIILALVGYFYFHSKQNGRTMMRRNFQVQLNESQISYLTSFFNSNPGLQEINNYCSENRGYCFYYCRNINQNAEICKDLMNRGNYSRVGYNRSRGNFSQK